jgi:hypothetical protein
MDPKGTCSRERRMQHDAVIKQIKVISPLQFTLVLAFLASFTTGRSKGASNFFFILLSKHEPSDPK